MDIEAISAHETPASDHAAHNISTSEVRPETSFIAWSNYVLVIPK